MRYPINVLIPMAGNGRRFKEAGYKLPKPLINVNGKPMIQQVVESLNIIGHYIFIVQQEHIDNHCLDYILNLLKPNCKIIIVDKVTEGAACTALLAKDLINNDTPLIIANSDQLIEACSVNKNLYIIDMQKKVIDGLIYLFYNNHPKWSYAKLDSDNYVTEVAEKNVISNHATVGVYGFSQGSDFVWAAEQMIAKDIRTNGEFYICPVYNQLIEAGKRIKGSYVKNMWGLGDPESFSYYLSHNKC